MGAASADQRGGQGTGAGGTDIFSKSSGAYDDALSTINRTISQAGQTASRGYNPSIINQPGQYNPSMIKNVQGYDPKSYTSRGYNAANYNSSGYDSSNFDAAGYDAQMAQGSTAAGPADIASGISKYMSPYTEDVINTSLADIERTRGIQQADNAGAAASAGAFGGSRHGLVEAETNRGALDTSARTAAQLRDTGFSQAANLSGIDIGNLQQNREFNAQMQQANSQYNAASENAQREYNAGNLQQARQYEAEARNIAEQFNATAANAAKQFNTGATNTARQFGADASNTAKQFNTASVNAAREFNTSSQNQAKVLNAASANAAGQFNANARNDAKFANQDVRTQAARDKYLSQLGLAGTGIDASRALGELSRSGLDMGRAITGDQAQQGQLAQNVTQAILNAGQDMFTNYTDSPKDALNTMLATLGLNPAAKTGTTSGTSTTTNNPSPLSILGGVLGGVGQAVGAAK